MFHTVRYLRSEQIAYRLYYSIGKPLVVRQALAQLGDLARRPWLAPWVAPLVAPRSHFERGSFELIGEVGKVRSASDWNAASKSKLWLYNLHYLDDLNAVDSDTRKMQSAWLIQRWIDDNPPLSGTGWEPYPLSLRLVNLVKWCARQPAVPAQWLASLGRQTQALEAQEERHILANHLFANGKALTFAGTFFAGDDATRWLRRGLNILDREIEEQFLADGGHFELSPMYHATLLWDMCDLVNLAQRSGGRGLTERAAAWLGVIEKGRAWLDGMSHPDGEIAFFNDSAMGIAPKPDAVDAYAAALTGARCERCAIPLTYMNHSDSGYITVHLEAGGKAFLDVAQVGPSYQPGHAHADTLSFELSLFGQRVLVNSGTSQYGEDAQRQRQRSTSAHNTVEVDGEDSSEVWAGFRVARRARPTPPSIWREASHDGEKLLVRCTHDGYRRLPGAPVHQRQWEFTARGLRIVDSLTGQFRKALSRFYLHPDVRVNCTDTLYLADGHKVCWSVMGGQAQIVPASWHPRFGVSRSNNCIEVLFDGNEVSVDFSWK